jgi:hypothetical protein
MYQIEENNYVTLLSKCLKDITSLLTKDDVEKIYTRLLTCHAYRYLIEYHGDLTQLSSQGIEGKINKLQKKHLKGREMIKELHNQCDKFTVKKE